MVFTTKRTAGLSLSGGTPMSIQRKVRAGLMWIMSALLLLGILSYVVARVLRAQLQIATEVTPASAYIQQFLAAIYMVFFIAILKCVWEWWSVTRSIRAVSRRLGDAEAQLAASAEELRVAAAKQASGATEEAAAVSEITATVEELLRTAHEMARMVEQGLAAAEDGQGAVRESVEGMARIQARVDDVAGRTLLLGERSQRIGEINEIISDVAGKTHLLAINAAIESAAAGEFGARFAVVAAQVKELADETREATGQVKSVIQEIQNAINASVMATEETAKEVNRGAELAARAGTVIEEMVERVQGISLSTQQQQTATEQVLITMRDIQEVARQSAESIQQTADNAAQLVGIATQLGQVVAQLSEDVPAKTR